MTPETLRIGGPLLCTDGKPHDWHSGQSHTVDCVECGIWLTKVQFNLRHDRLEVALAASEQARQKAETAARRCDLNRLADFMEANATNLAEGWKWEDDIRALAAALAPGAPKDTES